MTFRIALRRIGAAAGLALAVSAAPAWADETQEAKLKTAREVIDVSGAAETFDGIIPIFLDEAKRTFVRTRPELSKDFDEVIKTLQPEFEARREQLLNDVATVYAERFSDQELTDIKTFYMTPSGKKLVQILPAVLQASYEKTNAWSRQMSQDVVSRMRQEMKKRGHDI
ncbi:hypothetical protein JOD31_003238 [Methylopila capsulata]|uniref:DUF2059 domain-containing protein n=1 Tax=Methylopila capsulata TaxID=61654 RepID=A0A9W6IY55_9HYPH|nr:DUF2059 domain-containing protein [Methylopila capsulata]MBM7852987.1 hypothetical protein [Methylopila capsulata]GLK57802.1 hypothetical protein GCM10008170_38220 [Methylopila capsulata]